MNTTTSTHEKVHPWANRPGERLVDTIRWVAEVANSAPEYVWDGKSARDVFAIVAAASLSERDTPIASWTDRQIEEACRGIVPEWYDHGEAAHPKDQKRFDVSKVFSRADREVAS